MSMSKKDFAYQNNIFLTQFECQNRVLNENGISRFSADVQKRFEYQNKIFQFF